MTPYSLSVSNLLEGEYQVRIKHRNYGYQNCCATPINIRVVKLGIKSPNVTREGRPQFDVVTAFPGKQILIQVSTNVLAWTSISTNVPATNTFTFVDVSATNFGQRFYRAVVPP